MSSMNSIVIQLRQLAQSYITSIPEFSKRYEEVANDYETLEENRTKYPVEVIKEWTTYIRSWISEHPTESDTLLLTQKELEEKIKKDTQLNKELTSLIHAKKEVLKEDTIPVAKPVEEFQEQDLNIPIAKPVEEFQEQDLDIPIAEPVDTLKGKDSVNTKHSRKGTPLLYD